MQASAQNALECFGENLQIIDLGLCDYPEAYSIQKTWVERKKQDLTAPDVLLLVEHPPVYTTGRGSAVPDGVAAFSIERGGKVTFHNPGQLVAYPILRLENSQRDLHRYLRVLETVLIDTLAYFGIRAERKENATGVWVGSHKIASIGVAVSGWVTYHGIALNVENDLTGFSQISPCGFSPEVMISMRKLLGENGPSLSQVKQVFAECFLRHFDPERGKIG